VKEDAYNRIRQVTRPNSGWVFMWTGSVPFMVQFNWSSRRARFSPHDFRFDLGSFCGSGELVACDVTPSRDHSVRHPFLLHYYLHKSNTITLWMMIPI
jgi:hypothetical protein